MEKFSRSVNMPHIFDHGEKRNVIAFAKTEEIKNLALNAGAEVVGGKEIITQIQVSFFFIYFHFLTKYLSNFCYVY